MPEQAISAQRRRDMNKEQEIAELREELARCREEILRLRDLLIGKNAELGAARGRLAELDDRSARIINVATRLQSGPTKVVWRASRALGNLRSHRG